MPISSLPLVFFVGGKTDLTLPLLAREVFGKYRDNERDWMQYSEDDGNDLNTRLQVINRARRRGDKRVWASDLVHSAR